jgi:oligoendopeptidase F
MEWDLTHIFKSDEEMESLISSLEIIVSQLEEYKGKIVNLNIEEIAELVNNYENFSFESSALGQYPGLRVNANSNDTDALALQNRVTKIQTGFRKRLAFITLDLGKLLNDKPELITSDMLSDYGYFLSRLQYQAKYKLSEDEEVLVLSKDQYGVTQWSRLQGELVGTTQYKITVNGKEEKYSWSSGYGLRSNKDHATRKAAIIGLGQGLENVLTT